MTWSASQYLTFEDERTRPVRDLLSAVPAASAAPPSDATGIMRAVDIGCGPGNSTEVLAERYPAARVSGLDSDPDMIAAARKRLPDVSFELGDIPQWLVAGADGSDDAGYDVILANAVLQWVPDHEALFPALISKLAQGGSLAVQMPDNLGEPAHRLMREVSDAGPWASSQAGARQARSSIAEAGWYYRLLKPHCQRVDIWRTTYQHALPGGAPAIVEWFKGSGLRPFLAPLDADEQAAYLAAYTREIAAAFPALDDGTVLLPFPRLFIVATR